MLLEHTRISRVRLRYVELMSCQFYVLLCIMSQHKVVRILST